MEKFSLFDFLVFLIPGGTALIILAWVLYQFVPDCLVLDNYSDTFLILAGLMPAYVIGQVLNFLGQKIEKVCDGVEKPWIKALEKDMELTIKLNEQCKAIFGFDFLDERNKIDEDKSNRFYDLAYAALDMNGLLEKIRILYAQFKFLYNTVALSFVCFVSAVVILVNNFILSNYSLNLCLQELSTIQALILMLLASFIGISALILAPGRRKFKMTNTLITFYVFNTTKK